MPRRGPHTIPPLTFTTPSIAGHNEKADKRAFPLSTPHWGITELFVEDRSVLCFNPCIGNIDRCREQTCA